MSRLLIPVGFVSAAIVAGAFFYASGKLSALKTEVRSLRGESDRAARPWQQLEALKKELERLGTRLDELTLEAQKQSSPVVGNTAVVGAESKDVGTRSENATAVRPKTIDGQKIIDDLGEAAFHTSSVARKWSVEELAAFIHERTGIEINLGDDFTKQALHQLKEKHDVRLKLVGIDQHVRVLRIRKELDRAGRFQEAPFGSTFPPSQGDRSDVVIDHGTADGKTQIERRYRITSSEFPEILQSKEDTNRAFAQFLDEVGDFLAESEKTE